MIKEISSLGGSIAGLVPPMVEEALKRKFRS
jgi:phosphopantetheine adenylyltransferase